MSYNFFYSIAILTGTIIGVGIFALPYAIAQVGFWPGIFYLILMAVVVTYLHLAFGEIILRTKNEHRLPGYVGVYLGQNFQRAVHVSTILGLLLTIVAYILVGGEFLSQIFSDSLPISVAYLIFWGISTFLIFSSFETFAKVEFFMTIFLIIIIALIFFSTLSQVNFNNFKGFKIENLFFPYGIVLFSLLGGVAIPEIKNVLINEKKRIKSAIITGTLLSAFIYLIFVSMVIGASDSGVEKLATLNLTKFLPPELNFFVHVLGLLLITTSHITVGRYLKESLIYDLKFNNFISSLIIIFVPIFLISLGFKDFITFISFVGSLTGGFEGVITMMVYLKAKKSGQRIPEYSLKINKFFIYLLIIIFSLGFLAGLFFELKNFF